MGGVVHEVRDEHAQAGLPARRTTGPSGISSANFVAGYRVLLTPLRARAWATWQSRELFSVRGHQQWAVVDPPVGHCGAERDERQLDRLGARPVGAPIYIA